ncbi:hypothetical protein Trichorick_01874 (plasmid) [Candidatus Trichorickettsia mobilis]|uniref:hypothetical protein n=1 Tax=Candidatus Trichorickettsia mobilis TaxID=1346319 RepID=UPI002B25C013|nr:hypothetical protein [Candidatus Trichorickettsia mobilis]WPY01950.1 hypothetical protein Trichorick_01874 [Candidatus Trichorickettsia mobilis]
MDIAKKILAIVTSGIIGSCLMLVYTEKLAGSNNYHILYVAEDELMSLEEDRIKNEDLSTRQLFFGEIEKAVSLAVSLPKTYKTGKNLVVYSMSSVRGENVRSISSEIHAKIIGELRKEDKTGNNDGD